jgi:archaeosine-15-forming tRNA-guanine transglycosylase
MAGDAKKVSELAVATTLSANDRVVVLVNPSTTANVKTITASNFANSVAAKFISNSVPTSNTSTGSPGQIAYSNNYIFVCVANNTWGRATLTLSW